jgi:hypothetical protein
LRVFPFLASISGGSRSGLSQRTRVVERRQVRIKPEVSAPNKIASFK